MAAADLWGIRPCCPSAGACHVLDRTTRTAIGRGTVRIVSTLIDIALDAVTPGAPVAVTFDAVGDHIIPSFA